MKIVAENTKEFDSLYELVRSIGYEGLNSAVVEANRDGTVSIELGTIETGRTIAGMRCVKRIGRIEVDYDEAVGSAKVMMVVEVAYRKAGSKVDTDVTLLVKYKGAGNPSKVIIFLPEMLTEQA